MCRAIQITQKSSISSQTAILFPAELTVIYLSRQIFMRRYSSFKIAFSNTLYKLTPFTLTRIIMARRGSRFNP